MSRGNRPGLFFYLVKNFTLRGIIAVPLQNPPEYGSENQRRSVFLFAVGETE